MVSLLISRATLIWIILVVATGMAWGMGHGLGGTDVRLAGVVIFGISFVKVRLVIREFMEIRGAPQFMRVVSDLWVVAICARLIGLFLSAPP